MFVRKVIVIASIIMIIFITIGILASCNKGRTRTSSSITINKTPIITSLIKITIGTTKASTLSPESTSATIQTSASTSTPQPVISGINGKVMIGPITPVQKEGEVNEKPYSDALIFIMDSTGSSKITEVISDQNGLFKIYIAPGTYLLDPQTPHDQRFPVTGTQIVVVLENMFTDVTINFDTGIR